MTLELCLEVESVRMALEAMRQAEALGPMHPLARFVSIQHGVYARGIVGGTAASDALIFRSLARIIKRYLNHHRGLYGLPPVAPRSSDAAVQEDFQHGNQELESWSVLYYRYVRVDLDLSIDRLEQLTSQDRRTLQRRQSRGLTRLTHILALRETRERARERTVTLRSRLPRPYPARLIGRDTLVERALSRLAAPQPPRHLLLLGTPGVGKTALALALAHHLVEQGQIQNLAWIDQPDEQIERLVERAALELGIPLGLDTRPALANYLQVVDTLLVLDQVKFDHTASFEHLLNPFGAARLLICMSDPGPIPNLARLYVPPLDKEAAFQFMEREASNLGKTVEIGDFARLYDDFGGNPRALYHALAAGKRYSASSISAAIYQPIWDESDQLARLIWLVVALFPGASIAEDALSQILPDSDLEESLQRLIEDGVVESGQGDKPVVSLLPLAQLLSRHMLEEQSQRALAQSALQTVADYLAVRPDPARCLHLLKSAQDADPAAALLLDLAYSFAPIVEHAGAWSTWSSYLADLQDRTDGRDRLWVQLHLGVAQRWLAQWGDASYLLSEVMRSAGQIGDFDLQADAMVEMAVVYRHQGLHSLTDQLLHRARRFYQREGHQAGLERVAAEQAQVALEKGDIPGAQRYLSGEVSLESPRLLSLAALVALRADQPEHALRYAELAQQRLIADLPRLARAIALLGQIHYQLGARAAAFNHMTLALSMMEETNDLLGHARTRINLAAMYLAEGNLRAALKYLRDLPAELERLGDLDSLRAALRNLELVNQIARRWADGRTP